MNGAVAYLEPYDEGPPRAHVNLMAQCRPCHRALEFPSLFRALADQGFRRVFGLALSHGLDRLDSLDIPRRDRAVLR